MHKQESITEDETQNSGILFLDTNRSPNLDLKAQT